MPSLDDLEIFYGDASVARAEVYARLAPPEGATGWRLSGRIYGPHCRHASTLPAAVTLVDLGPGPTLLARAVLPDPCFWSPALPALYRVTVELREDDKVVADVERELGIRMLGCRGQSLYLEGRRWVMRGVLREEAGDEPPAAWREASAAMVVESPDDDLCREASSEGLLLAVSVDGDNPAVDRELLRLSRWAAVAMVIVENNPPRDKYLGRRAPNLLLAQRMRPDDISSLAPWADVVVIEATDEASFASHASDCPLPVIAIRPLNEPMSLTAARRQCDTLQKDLARFGDYAGYIV